MAANRNAGSKTLGAIIKSSVYMRLSILKILFLSSIINLTSSSLIAQKKSIPYQFPSYEFKLYTEKIKFHVNDTIYPFTIFIDTAGSFHFDQGFVQKWSHTASIVTPKKSYHQVFLPLTDSIIDIICLFPRLLLNDSETFEDTIIYNPWIPLMYELENSYVLQNLKEPSLYYGEKNRVIRILTKQDAIYISIRAEFINPGINLTYSAGELNSQGNFQIDIHKSCPIKEKRAKNLEKALNRIDFQKEIYFSQREISNPKYWEFVLIEYRNGNEYHILYRPTEIKIYEKVMSELIKLSRTCL
jgi:hypothetical protein